MMIQVTATNPDSGETSGQVELVDVSLGEVCILSIINSMYLRNCIFNLCICICTIYSSTQVWVCSGQSNMGFTVRQARDADMEIEKAVTYENIR